MNTKNYSITAILIILSTVSFGQKTLLSENINEAYQKEKFGPNRLHHFSILVNYNKPFYINTDNDLKTKQWGSHSVSTGIAYKLRICNHYAIGLRALLDFGVTKFETHSEFPFYTEELDGIEMKRMNTTDGILEFYNRINFGKRGNQIGKYLDLGVYVSSNLRNKYTSISKHEEHGVTVENTRKSKIQGLENYGYGLTARIGSKLLAINMKYRLSPVFSHLSNEKEINSPANFSIGLEFLIPVK